MRGLVSQIQRFSVSDGPGLRTTVFLKGCPLTCPWCHNPETQPAAPELMYYSAKCSLCRECEKICKNNIHHFDSGVHTVNRRLCPCCGACAENCPAEALEIRGKYMGVGEVMETVLRDRVFYETTGGGMTVSGGEPLAQFDFTAELFKAAKRFDLHTCLDTSGWGSGAARLVEYVDLFLWDIKEIDPDNHLRLTGAALNPILGSLADVDAAGGKIRLRCPIISGVNDRPDHMAAIGKIANGLKNIVGIDLIPYHNLGTAKAAAVGRTQDEFAPPGDESRANLLALLRRCTALECRWHQ